MGPGKAAPDQLDEQGHFDRFHNPSNAIALYVPTFSVQQNHSRNFASQRQRITCHSDPAAQKGEIRRSKHFEASESWRLCVLRETHLCVFEIISILVVLSVIRSAPAG
jgi:hypothetical protein